MLCFFGAEYENDFSYLPSRQDVSQIINFKIVKETKSCETLTLENRCKTFFSKLGLYNTGEYIPVTGVSYN